MSIKITLKGKTVEATEETKWQIADDLVKEMGGGVPTFEVVGASVPPPVPVPTSSSTPTPSHPEGFFWGLEVTFEPSDKPTGGSMDIKSKKDLAVDFINMVRRMGDRELNEMIVQQAGEDLAQFFLIYSANLIKKDPSRVLESASSLMLMGYLIATNENTGGLLGKATVGSA